MVESANDNSSYDRRKVAIMKHPKTGKEEEVRYHIAGRHTLAANPDAKAQLDRNKQKNTRGWEKPFMFTPPGYSPQVHKDRPAVRDAMENHSTFVNWQGAQDT